ncbi:nuclear transport factor 2 family protein [Pimelobacter simplex]|uniref:nuclear transport factor 2 family protein n=1 Tax=Nocardioides simplex TaxID=2045 RepID=UPI00214FCFBE|nr:nuclear transport factor 2 family protein [Pimelobacter simplex]UUW87102.1 nuclear transport factor 2 family protein [Pimelobacter simplex]UUW96608.1 nuclear transport factor 2 family protein [Pimelobacter simplex]
MSTSERAVERLLYRYADAIDAGDLAALGALFAHGRIAQHTSDGPLTLAEGSAAVEAFYRSLVILYDDGTPRTRHVTTNVVIDVDEAAGTALGAATYTVLQATEGLALQPIIVGRYRDSFRRVEGEWWFDTRAMSVDLTGDLSRHLRS